MITNLIRILSGRTFRPYLFSANRRVDYTQMRTTPGLYVHVPFCETLCPFCPYNKIAYEKLLCDEYADALIREIGLIGEKTGRYAASSLYFGGGSPTLLLDRLPEVLEVINENFDIEGEVAIEVNVADLNKSLARTLVDFGFTMISIGVQSFSEISNRNLGRVFVADAGDRVRVAVATGFDTVDVDLIFGIPGQTADDLTHDFAIAAECGATQISTYPFIDFSYADNANRPLGKRHKREMLSALVEVSEKYGFERGSVWSFLRAGSIKYSSITREAFIGFGASAASLCVDTFAINTFSVGEYIKTINDGKIPTSLSLRLDARTAAGYWLFWRLYGMDINKTVFRELFGKDIESMFGWELHLAQAGGLLIEGEDGYELTERGAYHYHLLEQEYTRKYIDRLWGTMRRTAWPEKAKVY